MTTNNAQDNLKLQSQIYSHPPCPIVHLSPIHLTWCFQNQIPMVTRIVIPLNYFIPMSCQFIFILAESVGHQIGCHTVFALAFYSQSSNPTKNQLCLSPFWSINQLLEISLTFSLLYLFLKALYFFLIHFKYNKASYKITLVFRFFYKI